MIQHIDSNTVANRNAVVKIGQLESPSEKMRQEDIPHKKDTASPYDGEDGKQKGTSMVCFLQAKSTRLVVKLDDLIAFIKSIESTRLH